MKNLSTPSGFLVSSYNKPPRPSGTPPLKRRGIFSLPLSPFSLLLFCFSALLLFPGCNYKKNNTLDAKINAIVAPDSLFVPTGDAELDSLLQLVAVAERDTNLVSLYLDIGEMYRNYDFEKAKEYYLKMKELTDSLDWNKGRYWYALYFTEIIGREGLVDSAMIIFQQALEMAKKEKNERMIAILNSNIGVVYSDKEWYETALRYYFEALEYFDKNNDESIRGQIYELISNVYRSIYAIDKAIEYGEKALELRGDNPQTMYYLAKAYWTGRQPQKSKDLFEEALELCKQQNDLYHMGNIYFELGIQAFSDFDLEKAENYFLQSLEIYKVFGNLEYDADCLIELGNLEVYKGNYSKAEKYLKEALQYIEENDDAVELKKICYRRLSELTLAQRRYKENYKYLEELYRVEDEVAARKNASAAREHEAKYETEKKQLEIEKQQQVIKRHNMQRWFFVSGIAVLAVFLVLLWVLYRLRNRQKQTLAEMNTTKDKFFTIISHDLKNPAVAQREALQMLLENAKQWDAEKLEHYYHGLMKSADGLVDLLYNLLNWAQLQTGRMPFKPVLYDIAADMRENTLSHLKGMAEHKGIELVTKLPDSALVTGDINMLKTVVRNLIDNAIKFTPKGGTVTLEIAHCTGVARNAPTTRISISDTGTGMTEEQICTLSGRDVARNVSTRGTANETGTGLGLTVCKELLEKHGSKLQIESEAGKGSTFWFEI